MVRAFLLAVRAAVLIGGSVAVTLVAAADREGDRRPTNTFVLVTAQPTKPTGPSAPAANGVGLAPAKPVVSNPYQVPLLQNAGTLRGAR
jgi:hypothetical protein